jgi:hypothetical protein
MSGYQQAKRIYIIRGSFLAITSFSLLMIASIYCGF